MIQWKFHSKHSKLLVSLSQLKFKNIDAQAVDSLSVFPFFDNLELEQLKTELPNYIAACEDVDTSHDILARSLSHWSTAALVAVKRVFSILKRSFSDTQYGSLQDVIETQ